MKIKEQHDANMLANMLANFKLMFSVACIRMEGFNERAEKERIWDVYVRSALDGCFMLGAISCRQYNDLKDLKDVVIDLIEKRNIKGAYYLRNCILDRNED